MNSFTYQKTPQSIPSSLGPLTLLESPHSKDLRFLKEYPQTSQSPSPLPNRDSRLTLTSPYLLKGFEFRFRSYANCQFDSCCFEYFENTLEEELAERKFKNREFMETEVIDILNQITQGLVALKGVGVNHGGVVPKAIFKAGGVYKIADQAMFLGDSNWLLNLGDNETYAFLSPGNIAKIHGNYYAQSNPEKDDIFSLGMTIFACLTFDNPKFYTNERPFGHNFGQIYSKLSVLSQKYSRELIDLLRIMLQENEEKRISLTDLSTYIAKLRENSRNIFFAATSIIRDSQEPLKKSGNFVPNPFIKSESQKKSQPTSPSPYVSQQVPLPNLLISQQRSPEPKMPNPQFSPSFKTPEKPSITDKIHRVTPGSLGKSSIKIVYTPSKRTEERNRELDEEYKKNLQKIESDKISTERSIGVLRDTIEFLKAVNSSPSLVESRVIDVNKL